MVDSSHTHIYPQLKWSQMLHILQLLMQMDSRWTRWRHDQAQYISIASNFSLLIKSHLHMSVIFWIWVFSLNVTTPVPKPVMHQSPESCSAATFRGEEGSLGDWQAGYHWVKVCVCVVCQHSSDLFPFDTGVCFSQNPTPLCFSFFQKSHTQQFPVEIHNLFIYGVHLENWGQWKWTDVRMRCWLCSETLFSCFRSTNQLTEEMRPQTD